MSCDGKSKMGKKMVINVKKKDGRENVGENVGGGIGKSAKREIADHANDVRRENSNK